MRLKDALLLRLWYTAFAAGSHDRQPKHYQEGRTMRYLISFLVGAFVGGLVALLFAPTSGEELRETIAREAESEWEKTSASIEARMQELQGTFEETRAQLMAYIEQEQADDAALAEAAEKAAEAAQDAADAAAEAAA
jgi:gas vesicle protein